MKKEVVSFLETVWLMQPRGTYGCIAWKEGEAWRQRYPHRDAIEEAYRNRGRDLYFCPNLLIRPRRLNECVAPSRWLYADLDEVYPGNLDIPATLWWETSRGRWQCMWQLEQVLKPELHSKLNQRMTYHCHADKNGWPLAKVLRIPGTVSTKWDEPWRITLDEGMGPVYDARELWDLVKDVEVPNSNFHVEGHVADLAMEAFPNLSNELRVLTARRKVRDRSAHVWQMACMMRDEELPPDQAVATLMHTVPAREKYGSRLGKQCEIVVAKAYNQRLRKQLDLPEPNVSDNGHKPVKSLFHQEEADRFLAKEFHPPGWMVGDIWSGNAHGLMVGPHKSFKSLLAMDLGFSVATGTKFLDHFDVPKQGQVIYIQEENQPNQVHDRLIKLVHSRNMQGFAKMSGDTLKIERADHIPMTIINNGGLDLTSRKHLRELIRLVREKKTKLLILDPLYLMIPGVEENSASSMVPVLKNLAAMKHKLGVGVLITHHYKKQDRDNPMTADDERIAGTSAFGRWYESLVLVERPKEDQTMVKLYPKHRLAPPLGRGIEVDFDMGDMGDPYYRPRVLVPKEQVRDLYERMRSEVEASPGITIAALARTFGKRVEPMGRLVGKASHFRVVPVRGGSPEVYLRKSS